MSLASKFQFLTSENGNVSNVSLIRHGTERPAMQVPTWHPLRRSEQPQPNMQCFRQLHSSIAPHLMQSFSCCSIKILKWIKGSSNFTKERSFYLIWLFIISYHLMLFHIISTNGFHKLFNAYCGIQLQRSKENQCSPIPQSLLYSPSEPFVKVSPLVDPLSGPQCLWGQRISQTQATSERKSRNWGETWSDFYCQMRHVPTGLVVPSHRFRCCSKSAISCAGIFMESSVAGASLHPDWSDKRKKAHSSNYSNQS